MRLRRAGAALSWALTWAAVISLAGCGALRDGQGQGRGRGPAEIAAVDGEDDDDECELLVVRRGEPAQRKEEKEPEDAQGFIYLGNQDLLLAEYRIDEEDDEACALAFNQQSHAGVGSGGLAPAAFGGAIPASAIAIGAAAIGLGLVVGVVAGGGGSDDDSPVSTPSTP